MSEEDRYMQQEIGPTWVRTYLLPLVALVLVVGVLVLLVLTEVVTSTQPRVAPQEAPTTMPTVEVVP